MILLIQMFFIKCSGFINWIFGSKKDKDSSLKSLWYIASKAGVIGTAAGLTLFNSYLSTKKNREWKEKEEKENEQNRLKVFDTYLLAEKKKKDTENKIKELKDEIKENESIVSLPGSISEKRIKDKKKCLNSQKAFIQIDINDADSEMKKEKNKIEKDAENIKKEIIRKKDAKYLKEKKEKEEFQKLFYEEIKLLNDEGLNKKKNEIKKIIDDYKNKNQLPYNHTPYILESFQLEIIEKEIIKRNEEKLDNKSLIIKKEQIEEEEEDEPETVIRKGNCIKGGKIVGKFNEIRKKTTKELELEVIKEILEERLLILIQKTNNVYLKILKDPTYNKNTEINQEFLKKEDLIMFNNQLSEAKFILKSIDSVNVEKLTNGLEICNNLEVSNNASISSIIEAFDKKFKVFFKTKKEAKNLLMEKGKSIVDEITKFIKEKTSNILFFNSKQLQEIDRQIVHLIHEKFIEILNISSKYKYIYVYQIPPHEIEEKIGYLKFGHHQEKELNNSENQVDLFILVYKEKMLYFLKDKFKNKTEDENKNSINFQNREILKQEEKERKEGTVSNQNIISTTILKKYFKKSLEI